MLAGLRPLTEGTQVDLLGGLRLREQLHLREAAHLTHVLPHGHLLHHLDASVALLLPLLRLPPLLHRRPAQRLPLGNYGRRRQPTVVSSKTFTSVIYNYYYKDLLCKIGADSLYLFGLKLFVEQVYDS